LLEVEKKIKGKKNHKRQAAMSLKEKNKKKFLTLCVFIVAMCLHS
jgi:hypothetical protein